MGEDLLICGQTMPSSYFNSRISLMSQSYRFSSKMIPIMGSLSRTGSPISGFQMAPLILSFSNIENNSSIESPCYFYRYGLITTMPLWSSS